MADVIRLDPAPSKVFSWLEFNPEAPATDHRPATSLLTVRYRTTGLETEHWPVTREEAQLIFNPGARYGFSIGSAFDQIVKKAGKSGRQVKSGDRQETKKQRSEIEARSGRRWLA